MQRVTRDTAANQASLAALEGKVALIRKHFPPSVANLYAVPRQGRDGALEWWSDLTGQPQRYHDLKSAEQQALLAQYQQRQQSVANLADALQARGQLAETQALRSLLGPPDLNNLYSLNGAPLVVSWGTPPPEAPVAPAPPAVPPPKPVRRLNLWPWLLGLLLPALVLALLWWLWSSRNYLFGLRPEITPYACQTNARGQAPEFAVVFDTSGSMGFNLDISREDEHWLTEIGQRLPASNPRVKRLTSGPTRMDVAKQSFTTMLDDLHSDIDIRLITFSGCDARVDHGIFAKAQRPALAAGIHNLQARGGTPLASSLRHAASLVDGRKRDAVIVLFVDGTDGCGQDVCRISREIARDQPRLRVNVVNISESQSSACIAENTGGRVYAASNSEAVTRMLRQATEEVSQTASCQ